MRFCIFLFLLCFLHCSSSKACTMYKITKNGKTIVGNNEDWISPNSQFWFEPGDDKAYGVLYMGQLNNFAQGGINEAGLVFDGFANPSLAVKNTKNKMNIPIFMAVNHAMRSYDNVTDIKQYLSGINLGSLVNSQLVFVDQKGAYLIVEGDELIIGNDAEKIFSNFYYSQVESIEKVDLKNVQNGLQFLKKTDAEASLDYCGSVMNSFSNVEQLTQYSTIYDLQELTIRIYLYQDFTDYVEIDLKEIVAQDDYRIMIADLFSKHSVGYQYYATYNDQNNPTKFIKEWIEPFNNSEEELVKNGFSFRLNWIGYEWLREKKDAKTAIKVFKYATELMPKQANLYDSLAEAYLKDQDVPKAIKNYEKSLALDPENKNAIKVLKNIRAQK